MPLDEDTLAEYREIMEAEMPDTAYFYGKEFVADTDDVTDMASDGAGGAVYNQDTALGGDDQGKFLFSCKCRATVPRANRENAEYINADVPVGETRIVFVFPWNTLAFQAHKVRYTTAYNLQYDCEIQVVAPHSEGITLQCNAVATTQPITVIAEEDAEEIGEGIIEEDIP